MRLEGHKQKNPLDVMAWRLEKTISAQAAPCEICGFYENVQMQHSRPLKDIKKTKTAVQKHIIAIQREQIPICRKHHLDTHGGNWANKPSKLASLFSPMAKTSGETK